MISTKQLSSLIVITIQYSPYFGLKSLVFHAFLSVVLMKEWYVVILITHQTNVLSRLDHIGRGSISLIGSRTYLRRLLPPGMGGVDEIFDDVMVRAADELRAVSGKLDEATFDNVGLTKLLTLESFEEMAVGIR